MAEIEIRFGAMSDPLAVQLERQGLPLPPLDAKHLQRDADALVRLRVRGLLTDAEGRKARKRLMKRIAKSVAAAAVGSSWEGKEARRGE